LVVVTASINGSLQYIHILLK